MRGAPIEISINPDDPRSIQRALDTEWLLTNGLGGYAMGTVLGANTRRYHGLLIAATRPPVGRVVALHSMVEQLIIPRHDGSEEIIDLSTQQFGGSDGEPMLHPGGWRNLRRFRLDQADRAVRWTYIVDGLAIHKELTVSSDFNAAHLNYRVEGAVGKCALHVRPFVALRDFHELDSQGDRGHTIGKRLNWLAFSRGSHELVVFQQSYFKWIEDPQWWKRFAYAQDRARGQSWQEDVFSPGALRFVEPDRSEVSIAVALTSRLAHPPPSETRRARQPVMNRPTGEHLDRLRHAADDFIVRRCAGNQWTASVIAGYPWFGDWGRDTMIALPGLMLSTGRLEEARSTLLTFAHALRNGLIPNLFDDSGQGAHYNSVDASLWLVHAVHEYFLAFSESSRGQGRGRMDSHSRDELIEACRQIIAAYRRGTDFNIGMNERDGLISAGDEGSQLTWMDAKRDGVVFTPRHGKAVEINALWFNALCCFAEMTSDMRERDELTSLSKKVAASFREQFWWNERACLHDVLLNEASDGCALVADGKLRPNQIFAASLPFSPLKEDQQRAVVKIVGDRLLTPFGLRTLDRNDPDYRGRYEGNLFQRDRAYHNGTVWPWLIGPFCEALLRVDGFSTRAKSKVRKIIQPLIDQTSHSTSGGCLGQIAEVYDGDPPHLPGGGCPAQAWSVAEVLRVLTLVE